MARCSRCAVLEGGGFSTASLEAHEAILDMHEEAVRRDFDHLNDTYKTIEDDRDWPWQCECGHEVRIGEEPGSTTMARSTRLVGSHRGGGCNCDPIITRHVEPKRS